MDTNQGLITHLLSQHDAQPFLRSSDAYMGNEGGYEDHVSCLADLSRDLDKRQPLLTHSDYPPLRVTRCIRMLHDVGSTTLLWSATRNWASEKPILMDCEPRGTSEYDEAHKSVLTKEGASDYLNLAPDELHDGCYSFRSALVLGAKQASHYSVRAFRLAQALSLSRPNCQDELLKAFYHVLKHQASQEDEATVRLYTGLSRASICKLVSPSPLPCLKSVRLVKH